MCTHMYIIPTYSDCNIYRWQLTSPSKPKTPLFPSTVKRQSDLRLRGDLHDPSQHGIDRLSQVSECKDGQHQNRTANHTDRYCNPLVATIITIIIILCYYCYYYCWVLLLIVIFILVMVGNVCLFVYTSGNLRCVLQLSVAHRWSPSVTAAP